MKITTVLFDLDGTLTDSGPGIMNSVKYALEKVGEPTPDVDELRKFIGPPLKGQFMEHCGIDEEKAAEMVTLYREYFTVTGIFENSVYDGVEEMLKTLKQAGIKIAMATSVQPDILIADEILSVGDVRFKKKCSERMQNMLSNGTTLLYVSHNMKSIEQLCDKALWLDHGLPVMQGTAKEVCAAYNKKMGV